MKNEKDIIAVEVDFEYKTLPPNYHITVVYSNGSELAQTLCAQDALSQYSHHLTANQRQTFATQAMVDSNLTIPSRLFGSSQHRQASRGDEKANPHDGCKCVVV